MASSRKLHVNRFKLFDTEKLLKDLVSQDRNSFSDGANILKIILRRIRREDISHGNTLLLMQGISRVCRTCPRSELVKLLQIFVDDSTLRTKLSLYIVNIPNIDRNDVLNFLNSMVTVLELTCEVLPTYSIETIVVLVSLLSSSISISKDDIYKSVKHSIQKLQESQNQIIQDIKSTSVTKCKTVHIEPPNNFRTINVLPSVSDIYLDARPFLRKNVLYGPYRDTEHYLDVQFRLLREDFVLPMRNAVNQMKEALMKGNQAPYLNDGRLYKRIRILGINCKKNDGVSRILQFDKKSLSMITWETSKRLMLGSLVCLSRDRFQTLGFGVVSDKNLDRLSEGYFSVKFDDNTSELLGTNPFEEYDMIESLAYFESYKHNLAVLQSIGEYELPMKKYVLNQKNHPGIDTEETPIYLRSEKAVNYDMSCLLKVNKENAQEKLKLAKCVDILDYEAWPKAEDMGMDQSQYKALQQALTKEFSIIQGPPGTGKTYIGLKILQVLLHNKSKWSKINFPKILIACYTNHALDQFLDGIIDVFPSIYPERLVRIGGHRNSPQRILECNLNAKSSKLLRHIIFPETNTEDDINYISNLLKASISGIVYDHDMEMIIGENNMIALQNQYRIFPECLHHIPIIVLWLCMGEKFTYQPHVYQTHSTIPDNTKLEDQIQDNNEEDDNEEFQQIVTDAISLLGTKTNKPTSFKIIAEQFRGEIVMTYDDILEGKLKVLQDLFKEIPHSKTILMNQLLRSDYMSMRQGAEVPNYKLWRLNEHDRWKLYRNWLLQYHEQKRSKIKDLCQEYNRLVEVYNNEKKQQEIRLLRNVNIIGITTTGAAKYHDLISAIEPQICIIEEAAEILESHIITTLTPSCEHVILIGDHQQLRPNPTSYTLAREFNLGISLFERMVKNNMYLNTLSVQHRMKPAFSQLLVPHIYKHLEDHEIVHTYPSIRGVGGDIFFLDHSQNEYSGIESRSHSNHHEANFVVGFCWYLLQQGYAPNRITVLTTYKGQQFLIKDLIKMADPKGRWSHKLHVVTVDNFQGEENDIILLSLVRSNDTGNIGFLKMSNRVCVALSRAKHGFYAIGNMKQLANNSKIWSKVLKDVEEKKLLVKNIPLFCFNHPDTCTRVKNIHDFVHTPKGGCSLPCDFRLNCGHVCTRICHPYDREHEHFVCKKPCTKSCPYEHPCKRQCSKCFKEKKCPECEKIVKRTMPKCNHDQLMHCYVSIDDHICDIPCNKELKCKHKCQNKCGESCTSKCKVIVLKTLPCGHGIDIECYKEDIDCQVMIEKTLPCGHMHKIRCCVDVDDVVCPVIISLSCSNNSEHVYQIKCYKKKLKSCYHVCNFMFDCGHQCQGTCGKCHNKGKHSDCRMNCEKYLKCNHKCMNMCFEPCIHKCNIMVSETLPCGHRTCKPCHVLIEDILCKEIVEKVLLCGHKHKMKCHTGVNEIQCSKNVSVTCKFNPNHEYQTTCCNSSKTECNNECGISLPCGHKCKYKCVQCLDRKVHGDCKMQCKKTLVCGHLCQRPCIECEDIGHHSLCCTPVERKLDCGHMIESLCSFLPPNCESTCGMLCSHRSCEQLCGQNCDPCTKPCAWQCPHVKCHKMCFQSCSRRCCNKPCDKVLQCGHTCSGYCGEPCIQTCYRCEKDNFVQVAKSLEYHISKPWGFVKLQPCNHNILGFYMDRYMGDEMKFMKEKQIIRYFTCPLCDTAIRYCPRYSRYINNVEEKMRKLKDLQTLETKRLDCLFEVIECHDKMITKLHLPSASDLLNTGIMCLQYATLNVYQRIEKCLDILNEIQRKTERKNIITFYKSKKQEIHAARETVKNIIICTNTNSLDIVIPSLETLLRSIVTLIDLVSTYRQNYAKQNIIQEMYKELFGLEYISEHDALKVSTIAKVSKMIDENFTEKQYIAKIPPLVQIHHWFTPVLLVPPGTKYIWVHCNLGKFHYLPDSSKSLHSASAAENKCFICECEVYPTNIFETSISPTCDRKSFKLIGDTQYNFAQKRLSFLEKYKFEEIIPKPSFKDDFEVSKCAKCNENNDAKGKTENNETNGETDNQDSIEMACSDKKSQTSSKLKCTRLLCYEKEPYYNITQKNREKITTSNPKSSTQNKQDNITTSRNKTTFSSRLSSEKRRDTRTYKANSRLASKHKEDKITTMNSRLSTGNMKDKITATNSRLSTGNKKDWGTETYYSQSTKIQQDKTVTNNSRLSTELKQDKIKIYSRPSAINKLDQRKTTNLRQHPEKNRISITSKNDVESKTLTKSRSATNNWSYRRSKTDSKQSAMNWRSSSQNWRENKTETKLRQFTVNLQDKTKPGSYDRRTDSNSSNNDFKDKVTQSAPSSEQDMITTDTSQKVSSKKSDKNY